MTILLAIETSTDTASVALDVHGVLLSRELPGTETHSSGILPAIQSLLAEAKITLSQCDAIAFGCGPGAFTGVRTACGVVQGLAYGADLPVVSVVSLLAMAESARQDSESAHVVCILDARMNEVYWAHYVYADHHWQVKIPPSLSSAQHAFSEAARVAATVVLGKGVSASPGFVNQHVLYAMPGAMSVARLGLRDIQAGLLLRPEQAEPLYLRNKIALTTAERQRDK